MTLEEFIEMRTTECSPIDIDLYVNNRYANALVYVAKRGEKMLENVFNEYKHYKVTGWYIDTFYDPNTITTLNLMLEP